MDKIDIQLGRILKLEANPRELQEHVIFLKARIKILDEEVKQYEDTMMALVRAEGGKVSCDFGEFTGDVSLCKRAKYKFSEDIAKLEQQAKYMDTKIKAKKMVEIASGAEIESHDEYLRYNIKIRREENGE